MTLSPHPDLKKHQHIAFLSGAILLLLLLVLLSMTVGNKPISLTVTWQALWQFDANVSDHLLVQNLRVPRSLVALVAGLALGLAGVIVQTLTRNPLAEPGLLGINAGATLAVVIAIAFFGVSQVFVHMLFGMLGALFAGLLVMYLADMKGKADPVRIILSGVALSAVLLAFAQTIIINSDEQIFDQYRHWIVGSMQGRGYPVLSILTLVTLVGFVLSMAISRALDTTSLGKELSHSLGLNVLTIWVISALIVVVLAGTATAAVGPIGFLGLVAPHIARFITGPNHRWLLPYAMLIAAILMLTADIVGRVIAHPAEISVGIMVALIGGPFFVILARRKRLFEL